ncbi:MAG: hypothetical protein QM831_06370 [Kofleriaceae bacterium]
MSKLDNIVERNVAAKKRDARKVWMAVGGFVFVVLAILSTCTSLGRPKAPPPPPKPTHVDGIWLKH